MKFSFVAIFCMFSSAAVSQLPFDSLNAAEIKNLMAYLSSDSMKGRGNYTPELHKAAHFIANVFETCAMEACFPGSYFQPFTTLQLSDSKEARDSTGRFDPKKVLLNVTGMLKGKTHPEEVVIFSAHYDHLGIMSSPERKDSIFNGANDNASGTVALLALARYFARLDNNERTLVFCAFDGEELGLWGSTTFVEKMPFSPSQVVAVINMEMIAIPTFGRNKIFITGAEKSSLEKIMWQELKNSPVKIRKEPRSVFPLFERSDNYPFAKRKIPAHSIMSSYDSDKCYHRPCDEFGRADIPHMVEVIKAIIRGTQSIVSGADTPKFF